MQLDAGKQMQREADDAQDRLCDLRGRHHQLLIADAPSGDLEECSWEDSANIAWHIREASISRAETMLETASQIQFSRIRPQRVSIRFEHA